MICRTPCTLLLVLSISAAARADPADEYEMVVDVRDCPRRALPLSIEVTTRDEIARNHGPTLAHSVDGKSGISFESDGPVNSRIAIRGLAGERVSLLLDGNPQVLVRNAGTDIPIDPWDVDRIELVKGANALARSPDTVGGLINVILRRPDLPRRGVHLGLDAASGFSSASDAVRWALRGHAAGNGHYLQLSTTANVTTADLRTGGGFRIPRSDHRLFTAGLIAGRQSSDGLVDLSYYGRFGLPVGTFRSKLYQDPDMRHIVGLKLRKTRLGPIDVAELNLSYMRFDVDFRFLGDDLRSTRKYYIGDWNNLALEAWTGIVLSPRNKLCLGGNFLWAPTHRFEETAEGDFVGDIFPHAARHFVGFFVQDQITVGNWLLLSAVTRLDWNRLRHERREVSGEFQQAQRMDRTGPRASHYLSLSGNLGANVLLGDVFSLWLNLGTAAQPTVPGKFSIFIPATPASPGRVGNPELGTERSLNAELGARIETGRTTVEVTGFVTPIFSYIAEYTSRSLQDPASPDLRFRTFTNQDALLYGIELGLRQQIVGRHLTLQATLSHAVGAFRELIPDSRSEDTDLPLVPPLRGYVALRARPTPALSLSVKARYAAPQPHASDLAGEQPTPRYGALDLNLSYTFRRLWFMHNVELYLDVLNATDAPYREHTVQYTGVAQGFEEAYLQPGIDVRTGIILAL